MIFEFDKYIFDYETSILKLYYNIDNFQFIEEINFNPKSKKIFPLTDEKKNALNIAFSYLHIVAGISYYKLFIPETIKINTIKLNKEQKFFFDKLYLNGLGEFSYKNKISLKNRINFPFTENINNVSSNVKLKDNIILPIGGGKDSIVSASIAEKSNKKIYNFVVNPVGPMLNYINNNDNETIIINRKISPTLLEMNKNSNKYKIYNGHIPITSIIIFISVCAGILYDCNTTIISAEKSANTGNLIYDNLVINHQWSKSIEAEKMIHNFIQKYIISSYNFFSLLRPIFEIHIAKLFSKINKYHNIFSSCNKNFKINKIEQNQKLWCCNCDKCRFVFLMLAPFIKKDEMINIFGKNLLNDETQLIGYEELTGFFGNRPFECVGEIEESILAFCLLQDTSFKDDFIVKKINSKILTQNINIEELKKKYFSINFNDTLLNQEYINLFNEYIKK